MKGGHRGIVNWKDLQTYCIWGTDDKCKTIRKLKSGSGQNAQMT